MSRTIDEKVVQMQFDNRQFETNVRTSMNTLEKLKQSLRLDDAAKGLDSVSNAAKRFDISPLGNGVEAVKMKFSALEVMAVTALANITNSAVNAGKRLVSAFTIEPIKTGFQEYELKMGSVQTIMASTGESLETVNRYLEELNEYSDKTIYSFSDMTQNIGKFTNAGVKLDDAVKAIKGISNEAAVSGANANEASRAMYNFAQALSAGYVKLIDWKSIENANMATVEFKQQLIETAVACGTLTDNLDGTYTTLEKGTVISATKNFNDSLQEQWMTTEVLVTTLGKYADETTDIGKKAYAAAQDVKTFSMMMDTLKEAAQSGWAQTWELLVGDFEEAKTLFTELSERFGTMIDNSSKARNNFLKGALDSKWDQFTDQINEAGIATDKFEDQLKKTLIQHGVIIEEEIEKEGSLLKVLQKNANAKKIIIETLQKFSSSQQTLSGTTGEVTGKLEEFQKIVNQVINGDFGNGEERINALNKAGYNSVAVQKLVDKAWQKNGRTFKDTTITAEDLTEVIGELSKEELENIGFTEEQAKKLKELADQAAITGTPINKLIEDIQKPSGRELIIDSLRNALDALQNVLGTFKKAWNNVFSPMSSDRLYDIIENIHAFTEKMVEASKNTDNLQNALEGLFTVLKIVKDVIVTITKVGIKLGWSILKPIAKFILNIASSVGTLIKKVYGADTKVFKPIKNAITSITKLIKGFSEFLDNVLGGISDFIGDTIDTWCKKLDESEAFKTASKFIKDGIDGITNALSDLKDHLSKFDFSFITDKLKVLGGFFVKIGSEIKNSEFGQSIISDVKKVFNKVANFIKSFKLPKLDTEKFVVSFSKFLDFLSQNNLSGIGGGIIGLFGYLKQQLSYKFEDFNNKVLLAFSNFYLKYGDSIKSGFKKCGEVLKAIVEFIFGSESIDLPSILKLTKEFLAIIALVKVINIFDNITGSLRSIGDGFENITKSIKWKSIGSVFKSIAIALGAFSVCLYIISKIPAKDAYRSLGILSGVLILMGGLVAGLTFLASKLEGGINMAAVTATIFGISLSLAILIFTLKKLDGMEFKNLGKSLGILFSVLFSMVLSIRMIGKACSGASLKSAAAIITILTSLKMVLSILEDYSKFPWSSVKKAIPRMVGMLLGLALVLRIATGGLKQGANSTGLALLMISIVFSLKILLKTIKELAEMDPDRMWQGIKGIIAVLGGIAVMLGIINLTNKGGILNKGQKAVNQFKGLAVALLAVAATVWVFGNMNTNKLIKGGAAVVVILGMFSVLFASIGKASSNGFKTASMLAMIIGLGLILAEMGLIVYKLSSVGWANAIGSAAALSILLITMTECFKALAKHQNGAKTIVKWIGALIGMGLVIAVLADILIKMKDIDPLNSIAQVTALSVLLGVMSGCLLALTKHYKIQEKNIYKWVKALGAMTVLVLALAGILGLLNVMKVDGRKAITQVTAISELLAVMTGCLVVLNKFGEVDKSIYKSILALGALGIVVAGLAGILGLLEYMHVDGGNAIGQVTAISILLLGMSGCILICSKVGKKAGAALPALGVLALFAIGLTAFLAALGGIDKYFNGGFVDVMERAVRIMELIGLAIGKLVGGIIGGVGAAIIATLPQMGKDLSDFMDNASGFFTGLENLKADMLVKAGILTGVIGILTYESMLNSLANILSIGHSLPNLGTDLGNFMINAMPFFNELENIPENATASVKNLADTIMTLTKASFLDGIGKLIGLGESNFETFGTSIAKFGSSLSAYAESIRNLTEDDLNKISLSSAAGEKLAELAKKIPNEGGVAGWLFGENNIGTFGTSIVAFGKGLVSYAESIANLTEDDITKIETSCEAGKQLSTLAETIPNEGGVAGWLFGENNLGAFGTSIVEFGKNLIKYAETVRDLTAGDEEKIASSAKAAKSLSDLADSIPNEDGVAGWLFGDNKISTFGESIVSFGESLMTYAKKVRSFTEDDVTKIGLSKKAADELVKVAKAIPNDKGLWGKIAGDQNLSKFGTGMADLAKGLSEYAKTAKGIDDDAVKSIKKSKEAVEAMADAAKKVPNEGSIWEIFTGKNDISNFGTGMVSLATGLISYAEVARQITDDDIIAIDRSTLAIMAIAIAAKVIPNTGGLAQLIIGTNDISSFSTGMVTLADGIMQYAEKVKDIGADDVMYIMMSALAINAITAAAKTIPNSGGLAQMIFGVNDINSFVDGMSTLADGIMDYATKVANINESTVETICTSGDAIVALGMVSRAVEVSFGSNGNLSTAIYNIDQLIEAINKMSTVGSSSIDGFVDAMNQLSTVSVTNFAKGFSGSSGRVISGINAMFNACVNAINSRKAIISNAFIKIVTYTLTSIRSKQPAFVQTGIMLMKMFASGVSKGSSTAKNAMNSACKSCISGISLYYGSFLSAGFSLAQGFAQGITIGTFMAAAAASAMANAAYQSAKKQLDINSPSKKFRKMAGCVPEGFAQGIDRLGGLVKNSSVNMAQIAIDSTQNAISQISRVVDDNIDVSPTIRPVVDMDNISTEKLRLFSNIDTFIAQPVDTWSQRILDAQSEINSSNNEVIRAIGGLRDDLKLMYDMVDAKDTNLYMDTKRVASSLAKPMNRELSVLAKRGSN